MAPKVQGTSGMNATKASILCPVCGAEMETTKTVRASYGSEKWTSYRCTCGHSETLKNDGSPVLTRHALLAVNGFHELPSHGE